MALAGGKASELINAAYSEQGLLSLYRFEMPKQAVESCQEMKLKAYSKINISIEKNISNYMLLR